MNRILTALALALLIAPVGSAHEIKALAGSQPLPEGGVKTTVYLFWGHRVPVDELLDAATLERYELLNPEGKATALKAEGKSLQTNVVELKEAGSIRSPSRSGRASSPTSSTTTGCGR